MLATAGADAGRARRDAGRWARSCGFPSLESRTVQARGYAGPPGRRPRGGLGRPGVGAVRWSGRSGRHRGLLPEPLLLDVSASLLEAGEVALLALVDGSEADHVVALDLADLAAEPVGHDVAPG